MSSLRGARVLVVEDDAMLSLNLEAMLLDLGCVVAGTADKLDDALQMARTSDFDVALLDINLGGKRADPVADAIRARGTPIVFVTGYGKTAASGLVLSLTTQQPWSGCLTKPGYEASVSLSFRRSHLAHWFKRRPARPQGPAMAPGQIQAD